MHIDILTPDHSIYSGEVNSVTVPGTEGGFTVLNNHAPIISTLNQGKIKVTEKNKTELFFDIKGGVVEVLQNKIIVLAE